MGGTEDGSIDAINRGTGDGFIYVYMQDFLKNFCI